MITFDPKGTTEPLSNLAAALRADSDATAVVVEVVRDGRAATAVQGVSDLSTGVAARAGQTFDIGSQTKMMTAVVVSQLAEEGLIDLDAPAAHWLPATTVDGLANADTATVRQLLGMTSGIPSYTDALNADGVPRFVEALLRNPGQVFGPEDSLEIARTMAPTSAPGETYAYSNTNVLLLGKLIETVTGQSLAETFETRIFAKAGMTATSARPFETDDPRLSSYATDPVTGELIDVTRTPWQLLGEGGVVSTTADMIAFLKALLVDRSLLGPEALAAMTDFQPVETLPGSEFGFGLGLARFALDDGRVLVGFTGSTFGTDSSTYLDLDSGTFVSLAGTAPDFASQGGSLLLLDAIRQSLDWAPVADDGGRVHIVSGAAAELALAQGPDGATLTLDDATLTLHRALGDLSTDSFCFADRSVLAIGERTADDIVIGRDHAEARTQYNQLLGRGGDDRLTGGAGGDRLDGGTGADRLNGGAGTDKLYGRGGGDRLDGGAGDDRLWGGGGGDRLNGGTGDDLLRGGVGRDFLTGGDGADTFRFLQFDSNPGARTPDVIRDFTPGADTIDLRAIAAADGDVLAWIGNDAFSDTSGELRFKRAGEGTMIEADLDGDGAADFALALCGRLDLCAPDFQL